MDSQQDMRPQWERLTHKNGAFAFEFDPVRGIARCVNRGGTVTYDLVALMAEARQRIAQVIDGTAQPPE